MQLFYHCFLSTRAVLSHFSHVQLCATLDCSLPDSSVHGILQAGILECVAMPSSRGSSMTQGSKLGLYCKRILYH